MFSDVLLPDPVFADTSLGEYGWLEFDEIVDAPFFECLRALAQRAGETELYAACIEPFPEENFGHTGVAVFSTLDAADDYHAFLDTELVKRHISARNIGNRFLFHGPTMSWAIHADRSVELAVGGHKHGGGWPAVPGLPWLPWEGVLEIASFPFRQRMPADVSQRYEANYRADSWFGEAGPKAR